MKSFYYFSKTKLKFIEIANFKKKFIAITVGTSLLVSALIFGAYYLYAFVLNLDSETKSLRIENSMLIEKVSEMLDNYEKIEAQLDTLNEYNNDLRLVANLRPIKKEDRKFGFGGRIQLDALPTSRSGLSKLVSNLDNTLNRVNSKLSFEKKNYREISAKFEYNQKLWSAIPAIKPTKVGRIGDQFGMRLHPILKFRRMHQGIDIIVDVGTEVYASGSGKVISVKYVSGLGLAVEIDHGFGYISRYGHLYKATVNVGQTIARGEKIALSGNSGQLTTGPHLHYEVLHKGIYLDPENFIFDELDIFDK